MKKYVKNLILAAVALCAVSASPLHAAVGPGNGTFFSPQVFLGYDADNYPVYYLSYFDTYTYDQDDNSYVYKYGFGWLYNFGPTSAIGDNDVYFYDFNEGDVLYTAPELYPYFYGFNLDHFIYYFEGSQPREFYDFDADQYIEY